MFHSVGGVPLWQALYGKAVQTPKISMRMYNHFEDILFFEFYYDGCVLSFLTLRSKSKICFRPNSWQLNSAHEFCSFFVNAF
jgi:hypothetical protein